MFSYGTSGMTQDIIWILLFISIVLFVFMIYVGICVIIIKNDVKELTDLEFKKYESANKSISDVHEENAKTEDTK